MRVRAKPREGEEPADIPDGVVLGHWIEGDAALPIVDSEVIWPFDQIHRHAAIFGGPGTGKTETAMRIGHEVASKTSMPVFYFSAAGGRDVERFATLMREAGRRVRVFPDDPFDAWRGDPEEVAGRLLRAMEIEDDGGLEYTLANQVFRAIRKGPNGPPRSSADLLGALDYDSLRAMDSMTFDGGNRKEFTRVIQRFRNFFFGLNGALDGDWSWEDVDAACIQLNATGLYRRQSTLTRLFLEDWTHYLSERKTPGQRSMMIIQRLGRDVMSAYSLQGVLGHASTFDAGVVMTWLSPAHIGSQDDAGTILNAVRTVISHAIGLSEEISKLAVPELDQNDLGSLPSGVAWVIDSGRAVKVDIEQV